MIARLIDVFSSMGFKGCFYSFLLSLIRKTIYVGRDDNIILEKTHIKFGYLLASLYLCH